MQNSGKKKNQLNLVVFKTLYMKMGHAINQNWKFLHI